MSRLLILISSLFLLTAAEPVPDEPVPEGSLSRLHAQCMAGCGENNDESTCTTLCDCTKEQFSTQLSQDEFKQLIAEIEVGSVGRNNRVFLDKTATFCAAKVPDPYNLPKPK